MFRSGRLAIVAPLAVAWAEGYWFSVRRCTAARLATPRQREAARMHGEVFALTGSHLTRWPHAYLPEFLMGEKAAEGFLHRHEPSA